MNRGIVSGRIFYPDGKPASNIYVKIAGVFGDNGRIQIKGITRSIGAGQTDSTAEGYSGADGRFSIPFIWSGAEFAEGLSVISIHLTALNKISGTSTVWGRIQVRGFLYKDLQNLLSSSSPILSNTDLNYYAPSLKSAIKKYLGSRFWNSALLTTESWILVGAAAIVLKPYTQSETGLNFETMPAPEFETPFSNNNTTEKKCSCTNKNTVVQEQNIAEGWEGDNESFTVRSVLIHLKTHHQITDEISRVLNCCVDPDFFIRRCDFVTKRKITGSVLWSPLSKTVTIITCINGRKTICTYNYTVLNSQLILKHKNCYLKKLTCSV